jgi:hypothetical protein
MPDPALPNFFIIGTGKAGTTSLYHYLRQHPQIFMSPVKEPSYFAPEICVENLGESFRRHVRRMSRGNLRSWLVKEWDEYLELFQNVRNETAIGEASVAYLWSKTAARNIASAIPDARIVMILRDPAERAFSQYMHQLATGLVRSTFREHIHRCMSHRDRTLGVYHPFLEVGLYSAQVQRYLTRFPDANVRVYWYEEAWKDAAAFLRDLFTFLGVDVAFRPDLSRRSLERRVPRFKSIHYAAKQLEVVHRVRELVPSAMRKPIGRLLFRKGKDLRMDPRDREYLVGYYREDIMKLALLMNRDLSDWLACE